MADCGEYTHQAIAYQGLFDLKDMQIIRAEIDSIDDEANTAAVTLLDECDIIYWLDVDAVLFFYHCEFSTGTVEDLAKGYKAFAVGDMVYIILLPGKAGVLLPQAYIVGHVDIRGTRECSPREYLYIRFFFVLDEEEITVVTIYDVTAGATLDLASFEPIDESSPAPPASLPCLQTTAVLNWYAYNFSTAAAQVVIPCAVQYPSGVILAGVARNSPYTTLENTAYTGQVSGLCETIAVGNGFQRNFSEYDGPDVTAPYESYVYIKIQTDFSGVGISPVGGGHCITYAGAATTAYKEILSAGVGSRSISIEGVPGFTFSSFSIPFLVTNERESSATLVCDGETASIEALRSFGDKYVLDFSAIGGYQIEHTLESVITATFSVSPGPTEDGSEILDLTPTGGTNDHPGWGFPQQSDYLPFLFWTSIQDEGKSIKAGEVGAYVLWGAGSLQVWSVANEENPLLINVLMSGQPWGSRFIYDAFWGPGFKVLDYEYKICFYPYSTVTILEGNFVYPANIAIREVLEKADRDRSDGLNQSIAEVADTIKELFIDPLPTLTERNDATVEIFLGLQDGPSFTVLKKKVSI